MLHKNYVNFWMPQKEGLDLNQQATSWTAKFPVDQIQLLNLDWGEKIVILHIYFNIEQLPLERKIQKRKMIMWEGSCSPWELGLILCACILWPLLSPYISCVFFSAGTDEFYSWSEIHFLFLCRLQNHSST